MPNWVDQEFAITGPTGDIDRFCALAVTGNFQRDHTLDDEPTFLYSKVCPIRPRDRRTCADEHVDGVLFRFARTQVQAHFNIQTSWDFPRHFYLQRLLRDWPRLSICCAINEDMNNFGGVLAGFDGIAVDAVEDYAVPYDRKVHAKRVRPLTARWDRLLRARFEGSIFLSHHKIYLLPSRNSTPPFLTNPLRALSRIGNPIDTLPVYFPEERGKLIPEG